MKLTDVARRIVEAIKDSWMLKGHNLTGSAVESLKIEETERGVTIWGNHYMSIVDKGVDAVNIPFTIGSRGRGGKSRYLTGLKNYAKLRMGISDEREALGVAFAIATNHKKNGMVGSGFLKEVEKMNNIDIDNAMKEYIEKNIIKWHKLKQ